jgi:hypothetical protein
MLPNFCSFYKGGFIPVQRREVFEAAYKFSLGAEPPESHQNYCQSHQHDVALQH